MAAAAIISRQSNGVENEKRNQREKKYQKKAASK